MKRILGFVWIASMVLVSCEDEVSGPDRSGEILLSTESFVAEAYYIYGYSFEGSDMTRYPYVGDVVPDIINEGFRVIEDGELVSLPGFTSPAQVNGFVLLAEYESLAEARSYYASFHTIPEGMVFQVQSGTVRLNQVWLQKTSAGNYAKLLVTQIRQFESSGGVANNEVRIEFTYQPDGSPSFPE